METYSIGKGVDEARAFVCRMAGAFNPAKARGMTALVEFSFTDLGKSYQLRIEAGKCELVSGTPAKPSTTIITTFKDWKAISEGRLNGQQALMDGVYRVEGDFGFMMRMADGLFNGRDAAVSGTPTAGASITGRRKPNLLFVALVPWYLAWYLNSFSPLWWIALPLVIGTIFVIARRRRREETWFEWVTPACFAALGGLFLAVPDFTALHAGAIANLMMGVLWGMSLLVGRPITMEYSRNNYPAAITASTLFRRINGILTGVWTALFCAEAVLGFSITWKALPLILGLAMIPALVFTAAFPKSYMARLARKGGPGRQTELAA